MLTSLVLLASLDVSLIFCDATSTLLLLPIFWLLLASLSCWAIVSCQLLPCLLLSMSLLPLVSPAFMDYSCCWWRLLILSCASIEPAVADVLTAVDVSGVGVPAVVVFQMLLTSLLLLTFLFILVLSTFWRSSRCSCLGCCWRSCCCCLPDVAGVPTVGNMCSCCITKNVTLRLPAFHTMTIGPIICLLMGLLIIGSLT